MSLFGLFGGAIPDWLNGGYAGCTCGMNSLSNPYPCQVHFQPFSYNAQAAYQAQQAFEAAMRAQAGQRTEQNKTPPKGEGFVIDGEYEVVTEKKELPKPEDK